MTPLDDHSHRRQPLLLPVVIATALLTIIGLVGGYLLAERRGGDEGSTPSDMVSLLPAGPACVDQTQRMGAQFGASGELRQVLRVRTETRSVVWICQDDRAHLYYHANSGGAEAPWVENKTALFLPDVTYDGTGDFTAVATDDTGITTFTVSRERLMITHRNGRIETQEVVPE